MKGKKSSGGWWWIYDFVFWLGLPWAGRKWNMKGSQKTGCSCWQALLEHFDQGCLLHWWVWVEPGRQLSWMFLQAGKQQAILKVTSTLLVILRSSRLLLAFQVIVSRMTFTLHRSQFMSPLFTQHGFAWQQISTLPSRVYVVVPPPLPAWQKSSLSSSAVFIYSITIFHFPEMGFFYGWLEWNSIKMLKTWVGFFHWCSNLWRKWWSW